MIRRTTPTPRPASTPSIPPVEPMLAKLASELPDGEGVLFEPKWDGFRAIVFRGGGRAYIQSRELRPLNRYFPDVHAAVLTHLPDGCVVDGEIVIATAHGLDFDALQMRLHPAASRVEKLSKVTPASFVAFDLLAADGRDLREMPQADRRAELERLLQQTCPAGPPHACHARSSGRCRMAAAVRRRRSRRCHRQARRAAVSAGQARDVQDQARAHGRLRRRRLSLAQGRRRSRRVAAARPVRRRRGRSITSASRLRSRWPAGASSPTNWRRCASRRWTGTRGGPGPLRAARP